MVNVQCITVLFHIVYISAVTSQEVDTLNVDGVQEILVPMCRNFLPYNLTKLPNKYGHETQLQVYRALEYLWPYMDYECSQNFRLLACGTYLPKYDPTTQQTQMPCKKACSYARKRCLKTMRTTSTRWPSHFRCKEYKSSNCIRQKRERRGDIDYPYCISNTIPMCANMSISTGFIPNHYGQPSFEQVSTEIRYFDRLVESGCSPDLKFLLCGAFMPFCVVDTGYLYSIPCKELCTQVYSDCADTYNRLYNGLPWPTKFQCHRFYDSATNTRCTMPGDF